MDDFNIPGLGGGSGSQGSHEPIPVTSNYNKISESLRRVAPPQLQCSVFCGGRRCKYESSTYWSSEQCTLKGIFSTWITDDVLAMCRPNTSTIQEFNLIGQFHTVGIKSVINLQVPGEHSSCSSGPLHASGFSYDPTFLMDNGIYFYNYSWRDYGEASLAHLLDMVKVLSFAATQGKVAVHCHAGLGRTGVLIACYLVYSMRLRANDAVRLVRSKRPGSIQSRLHILCVQQFEQFILPNCIIFCNRDLLKDKKIQDFTLQMYLKRQRFILHGRESKTLRHIPKILNVVLERILTLCGGQNILPVVLDDDDPPTIAGTPDTIASPDGAATPDSASMSSPIETKAPINTFKPDDMSSSSSTTESVYKIQDVIRALLSDHINMVEGLARYVRQYRVELNHKGVGAWIRLGNEKNLYVLTALFLLWLEHLRVPLLSSEELTTVVLYADDPASTLQRLPLETAFSLDYILHFVANLNAGNTETEGVLRRLAASLTHRIVPGTSTIKVYLGYHTQSSEKGKPRVLSEGTLNKMMLLLNGILNLKRNGISPPLLKIAPSSAQSPTSPAGVASPPP